MKLDMKAQGWLTLSDQRHFFMAGFRLSQCGQARDTTTTDRDSHHRPPVNDPSVCRNCWQLSDF